MSNKTNRDIRIELIKIAQNQCMQEFYQKADALRARKPNVTVSEIQDLFPSIEQIIRKAEQLSEFVEAV